MLELSLLDEQREPVGKRELLKSRDLVSLAAEHTATRGRVGGEELAQALPAALRFPRRKLGGTTQHVLQNRAQDGLGRRDTATPPLGHDNLDHAR